MPFRSLDKTDRQLLALLSEDSSRPLKTLAGAVGLSRSSVRDRVARMRSTGVIRRFTVDVAPDVGAVRAILLLRLRQTPDPMVVKAVSERPNVVRCYSLSGPVDLLVELVGAQVEELNSERDAIASLPGVSDVETSLVLKQDKAPREG